MRLNDVLTERIDTFATRSTLERERPGACNDCSAIEMSGFQDTDLRLFADTPRSCFFIQIQFSALKSNEILSDAISLGPLSHLYGALFMRFSQP